MSRKHENILSLALLFVGMLWGGGFIAVQVSLNSGLSPALTNFFRFFLATFLILVFFFKKVKTITKAELKMGIVPSIIMSAGFLLQSSSQLFASPGNVAFITASYIILVPIISKIFFKGKITLIQGIAALITFSGIGILSLGSFSAGSFGMGELLSFLCAVFFALHFIVLEKPSKKMDSIKLTFIQMFFAAIMFLIYAVVTDFKSFANISKITMPNGLLSLLYLGVFSSFVAYLAQTFAQKHISPSKTALIMSTESVFGGLFSVLFGFEAFTFYLLFGGLISTVGVVLSEVKIFRKRKLKNELKKIIPGTDIRQNEESPTEQKEENLSQPHSETTSETHLE